MNLTGRERCIVHPYFVDDAIEIISTRSSADIGVHTGKRLRCGYGATQNPIVEHAININIQTLRSGIIDAGDVIPSVQCEDRLAITLSV